MGPRRIILAALVVLALGAACALRGMAAGEVAKPRTFASSAPTAPSAVPSGPERFSGVASPTEVVVPTPVAGPVIGQPVGAVPVAHPAVVPVAAKPLNPQAGQSGPIQWPSLPASAFTGGQDRQRAQPYVDPAALIIAGMADQADDSRQGGNRSHGGGGPINGASNNLAPLPGGSGLVINDGRIPVGFVINPREYAGGVLHITNASGTPAILTINDPAAAAACTIAGETVVVGRPYDVDGLEITAAHPVAVFVQPGRAPGPPAGPRRPQSDG